MAHAPSTGTWITGVYETGIEVDRAGTARYSLTGEAAVTFTGSFQRNNTGRFPPLVGNAVVLNWKGTGSQLGLVGEFNFVAAAVLNYAFVPSFPPGVPGVLPVVGVPEAVPKVGVPAAEAQAGVSSVSGDTGTSKVRVDTGVPSVKPKQGVPSVKVDE